MKRDAINARFGLGAATGVAILAGILAGVGPARAFDDRPNSLSPILNVIGLGADDSDKPAIDFRERPRLVVPKGDDLPPPQASASARAANWPQDQDVVRRKAAQAAERAPRSISPNTNPILNHDEIMRGRTNEAETSPELCPVKNQGAPDCSALTPADKLKQLFKLGSNEEKADTTRPGVEPDREFLTEPPKGYRKATRVVKATTDGPVKKYEAPSAGDYARGVDPNKPKDDDYQ